MSEGFVFTFDKDEDGNDIATLRSVRVTNKDLCVALSDHKASQSTSIFDKCPVEFFADDLFRIFSGFLAPQETATSKAVARFVKDVTPYYNTHIETIKTSLKSSRVRFRDLWYAFEKGTEVVVTERDTPMGVLVCDTSYHVNSYGVDFIAQVSYVQTDGNKFGIVKRRVTISQYSGTMSLNKLPMVRLSATTPRKKRLAARGKIFVSLAHKASHMYYEGTTYRDSWPAPIQSYVDGRVMVDVCMFRKHNTKDGVFAHQNQSVGDFWAEDDDNDAKKKNPEIGALDEKYHWMTWPTLPAFCLTTKKWVEVLYERLKPIEFRTDAFTKLVLDESVKRTIRSNVEMQMEHKESLFGDIIAGKGSGVMFLLHGPPGVGKTSSAEAIADERRCPLYSITVGELGTQADELEKRLHRVLLTAARWNAIILLDEADVFLEARSVNDVKRNAMVSIFLRLLEYHSGIMFMTTNRVISFDEAILNRISIGIVYRNFDTNTRRQVWSNMLEAAKVTTVDFDALVSHELNGRQIRTIIRLSGAVAMKEARPLQLADIEATIKLTLDFVAHMKQ